MKLTDTVHSERTKKRDAVSWERCLVCKNNAHKDPVERDACITGGARMAEIRLKCGLPIHKIGKACIAYVKKLEGKK
jgi:hypothetical protein